MATSNTAYQPAVYNTGILRGDTFSESFTFATGGVPLDLTGASVRIQLRNRSGGVIGSFENGSGIEAAQDGGAIVWTIEGSQTAAYAPGLYQYDIEVTTGSTVRTYLSGSFTVQKDITV